MVRLLGRDPVNGFIRLAGTRSPRWGAELRWLQQRQGFSRRVVEELISKGMTAVDIGASEGTYTNRMARLVGPSGRVHAFEPDPPSAQAVAAIAAHYPWVTVHQVALSDRSGSSSFTVPVVDGRRTTGLGSLPRQSLAPSGSRSETIDVAIDRLDSVLAEESSIGFIKCDVEGHEYEVLLGARDTLAQQHPHILVEIEQRHQQRDISETFAYLTDDLRYTGYAIAADGLLPIERFDVQLHQLGPLATLGGLDAPAWDQPGYVNDFLFVADRAHIGTLSVRS